MEGEKWHKRSELSRRLLLPSKNLFFLPSSFLRNKQEMCLTFIPFLCQERTEEEEKRCLQVSERILPACREEKLLHFKHFLFDIFERRKIVLSQLLQEEGWKNFTINCIPVFTQAFFFCRGPASRISHAIRLLKALFSLFSLALWTD